MAEPQFDPRSEEQADRESAQRAFVHPGDLLDGPTFAAEHPREVEMFRRLVFICMPARATYGGARRCEATYRRMVATVYLIAPEVFDGMRREEIARAVGLSMRAFDKQ